MDARISVRTLKRAEQGEKVSSATLSKLQEALGVSKEELSGERPLSPHFWLMNCEPSTPGCDTVTEEFGEFFESAFDLSLHLKKHITDRYSIPFFMMDDLDFHRSKLELKITTENDGATGYYSIEYLRVDCHNKSDEVDLSGEFNCLFTAKFRPFSKTTSRMDWLPISSYDTKVLSDALKYSLIDVVTDFVSPIASPIASPGFMLQLFKVSSESEWVTADPVLEKSFSSTAEFAIVTEIMSRLPIKHLSELSVGECSNSMVITLCLKKSNSIWKFDIIRGSLLDGRYAPWPNEHKRFWKKKLEKWIGDSLESNVFPDSETLDLSSEALNQDFNYRNVFGYPKIHEGDTNA